MNRFASRQRIVLVQVQPAWPAAQVMPVPPGARQLSPVQQSLCPLHCWPEVAHLVPPSVPVETGGAPQVPWFWPGGTVQTWPAQQSLDEVHTPPGATQVIPPSAGVRQRSLPSEPGTQGAPPQHSDEKVHCSPAAMQQGATPV